MEVLLLLFLIKTQLIDYTQEKENHLNWMVLIFIQILNMLIMGFIDYSFFPLFILFWVIPLAKIVVVSTTEIIRLWPKIKSGPNFSIQTYRWFIITLDVVRIY